MRSIALCLAITALSCGAVVLDRPGFEPLSETSLARISGRSISNAANLDACATTTKRPNEVTATSCGNAPPNTPCVSCGNGHSTRTIIPDTTGDVGSGPISGMVWTCSSINLKVGVCINNQCANPQPAGPCKGNPPAYLIQSQPGGQ